MINFVYQVGPTDHWDGWMPIREHWDPELESEVLQIPLNAFKAFQEAFYIAASSKNSFWEGDAHSLHFSGLPPSEVGDPTCNLFMVAWKQKNNGQTFYASPYPIPFYEDAQIYPVITKGQ